LAAVSAQKERIESELRIARDIQMSMVPSDFPQYEGLDIYAQMVPAREVGGDLYDCLLQDNRLYFCVGDVSGKGVPASLFMAQTMRLFRAFAKRSYQPDKIATRINDELTENNENGMFVTMFIGLLDLTTGRLDFCNCGHNPPVIASANVSEDVEFLHVEPNAPIGLWPGLEFVGETIDSIKGQPLLVYTDGLNEAEDCQQQQFGDDRLLQVLTAQSFESARQTIALLSTEIEKHRAGAEPNDDLTMLCLKLR
jgi:serine phosphatase RsbU (regulator of sigma subunit)